MTPKNVQRVLYYKRAIFYALSLVLHPTIQSLLDKHSLLFHIEFQLVIGHVLTITINIKSFVYVHEKIKILKVLMISNLL